MNNLSFYEGGVESMVAATLPQMKSEDGEEFYE
jgi:hypothetical protein